MELTASNYFSREAETAYMSVSQFKDFYACEARAMARLRGEYREGTSLAMLVGAYVDAYFEGTLAAFCEKNQSLLYRKDGTLKGAFLQAEHIIERLRRDKLFMEFMGGKKQAVVTGEIAGLPVKGKIDSLHADKIVDLKIMKDFKPIYKNGCGRVSFVEAFGYDLQGAVYRELVRQSTGKTLPFYIAAATKEAATDLAIIAVPTEFLDLELERFQTHIKRFHAVKIGAAAPYACGRCDWCRAHKRLTKITKLEELYYEYGDFER